jgi:hypothetical protein
MNRSGSVTVYEKKTYGWGGVFYFKNGDISVTQPIYEAEILKFLKP